MATSCWIVSNYQYFNLKKRPRDYVYYVNFGTVVMLWNVSCVVAMTKTQGGGERGERERVRERESVCVRERSME